MNRPLAGRNVLPKHREGRTRLARPGTENIYSQRRLKVIAARWDARAAQWERDLQDPACHLNEDAAYRRFLQHLRRLVRERGEFCARHGVIDAGCGTGLVLDTVSSAFAWGLGVDISAEMIAVARTKQLENVQFVIGDCFALRSICPKAGAVVSRGVLLSHYGRPQGQALLRAARGILVEGGFLLFDFLNGAARGRHQHVPEHKTWLTAEEVCAMARGAGFSRTRVLGGAERRVRLLLAE
jgi:predicted TPR repeat methyltransferase